MYSSEYTWYSKAGKRQEEKDLSAPEQKPLQVQQNLVRTTTRAAYRNGLRGVKDMKECHDEDVHLYISTVRSGLNPLFSSVDLCGEI